MMTKRLPFIAAALSLGACTSQAVGQLPATTTVPVSSSKLQFAVGIATMAGTGGMLEALNVVETFRNTSGASATTTNTPTISGPAGGFGDPAITTLTGLTLPQQSSIGESIVQGTLPANVTLPFSTRTSDVFGNETGAFGYGLAPDNLADPASSAELSTLPSCSLFQANDSVRYQSETVPISAANPGTICNPIPPSPGGVVSNQFYGGPPLWPSPAGYGLPIGFLGYSSGFSSFLPCTDSLCGTAAAPPVGAYTLSVAVPSGGADPNAYTTITAPAKLPAGVVAAPLPQVSPPALHIQSDGTGLIDVDVPADPRIFETIVYVTVPDCGLGFVAPVGNEPLHYYSLITKTPGPQTLLLSNLGPPGAGGMPTHTFCVASDAQALTGIDASAPDFGATLTVVSFDYPAYESSYPANRQQQPTIANATTGTADLSISRPLVCSNYAIPLPGTPTTCIP